MRVKDFILTGLDQDMDLKKKEIRLIKKEISYIWEMRKAVKIMKAAELEELMKNEPEMYARYKELSAMVEDKDRKEIKRMMKEGKLREVFLDEQGQVITDDSESAQPVNVDGSEGRPSDSDSRDNVGVESVK